MADSGRDYRLLIVDDDEIDRRTYIDLLTRRASGSCAVVQASDGRAGLAALRTQAFDCVLLDFSLPDMTGLEFLIEAVVNGQLPCAFVVVTRHGNEAVAVVAMKRGVQDYLPKDRVNASSLWRAITQAVRQAELHERLAESLRDLTLANIALEQEVATRKATETALRAAKDLAEQASQAKTRFAAMVTHELRTPLNGILGYAQLLRIEGTLSQQQNARVDAMMAAGRHLRDMIESVLDFASIETGQIELHPTLVSLDEQIDDCLAFIEPMAADRLLSLRSVRARGAPRHILADRQRLRQVLLNLLGNAVKYTASGSVELRLLPTATQGLRIEIADTGPGIEEANRVRLFQDFERLDAVTSLEGAGLGLAIAARIVRLMNGTIGYLPNPDSGSIFWLELPVGDVTDAPPAKIAVAEMPTVSRSVLVVEDVAMNRDVIGAFLRAAGHRVAMAEDGQQAVAAMMAHGFDVVLMDVRMPVMDGLEATRQIRALPGAAGQVPIIALTAYAFADQVAQCRDAGMNGHISKPVDYATLIRTIADLASPGPRPVGTGHAVASPESVRTLPCPGFDRGWLDETLSFVPREAVTEHLQALRGLGDQMLRHLEHPGTPDLTDLAHTLASSAGTFGFTALSQVTRRFEYALMRDAPEADRLAAQVQAEIRTAIAMLDRLILEHGLELV